MINKFKLNLAKMIWRKIEEWGAKHTDITLHDPKNETKSVKLSYPYEFNIAGKSLQVELQNMRHYKRWRSLSDEMKKNVNDMNTPIAWLVKNIQKDSIVYDVGANVGNIGTLACLLEPEARVFAFEPEPNSFLQLCRTISLNNLNIIPHSFALSDSIELNKFHIDKAFDAALSNHQFGDAVTSAANPFKQAFEIGTFSFTLDSLVYEHGMPPPTLVKIDVDGIDAKVVKGMERILASGSVKSVVTEATGRKNINIITNIMENNGFIQKNKESEIEQVSCDLVFDRSE